MYKICLHIGARRLVCRRRECNCLSSLQPRKLLCSFANCRANVGYRLVSWASIVRFFLMGILQMVGVGLYCETLFSDPIFSGGVLSTFIHLSLGKAGPFTKKESHIHVKALKMPMVPQIKKYAFGTCFSVGLQRCCQDLYFFSAFVWTTPPLPQTNSTNWHESF